MNRVCLAFLVPALLAAGCTAETKATDDASRVALDYARALDSGQPAQCDLSVEGRADRDHCMASLEAPHAYAGEPEVVGSYEWPTEGGTGRAVAVKVTLKANPQEAQIQAFGLVQMDGQWLVSANGWTDGPSDAASTIGALE